MIMIISKFYFKQKKLGVDYLLGGGILGVLGAPRYLGQGGILGGGGNGCLLKWGSPKMGDSSG